jgi:TRAP-type C4-dicarboxylate transport system permease small subunit
MIQALARWMNLAAGWVFVFCAFFITFEVLARNFLGWSTKSTTELSGYMLAVGISWGLAHALAERAHVRIDVLINRMRPRLRHNLHAVALLLLSVFAFAMCYGAWKLVEESLMFNATDMGGLRTPLAIPQGLWAAGLFVFALFCLVTLLEVIGFLSSGRGVEADRLLGSRTYEEEAKEALDAIQEGEAARRRAAGGKGAP